jgi:hypothetical protein
MSLPSFQHCAAERLHLQTPATLTTNAGRWCEGSQDTYRRGYRFVHINTSVLTCYVGASRFNQPK